MTDLIPPKFNLPKQGGVRDNAGRNLTIDKKEQTYLYIRRSAIAKLGGKKKCQEIMQKAIDEALVNLTTK